MIQRKNGLIDILSPNKELRKIERLKILNNNITKLSKNSFIKFYLHEQISSSTLKNTFLKGIVHKRSPCKITILAPNVPFDPAFVWSPKVKGPSTNPLSKKYGNLLRTEL